MKHAPIPDNNYGSPNEETSRVFRVNRNRRKKSRHGKRSNQFRPPNLRKAVGRR